jgi:hypothetical protein
MARWRAVPTAVSTAVGALAFLASTGLAIVLGAGLNVWTGPAAPGGPGSRALSAAPSVTGRVGGVVTVAPPASGAAAPRSGSTGSPATTVLPFVPFAPSTSTPSTSTPSTSTPAATALPGPTAATGRPASTAGAPAVPPGLHPAGRLSIDLRGLLSPFSALRSTTTDTTGRAASTPAHARPSLRDTADTDGSAQDRGRGHARSSGPRHGHHDTIGDRRHHRGDGVRSRPGHHGGHGGHHARHHARHHG